MRSITRSAILTLLLVPGFAVAAQSQQRAKPADQPTQAQFQATIEQATQNFLRTTAQFENGTISSAEVQSAQIELAEARIQLAALEQKPQVIIENLETIVTHREHLWAMATEQYKAGITSAADRNMARVKLGQARIRLESAIVLAMYEENLSAVTERYKAGLAARPDVEAAQKEVDELRRHLSMNPVE